MTKIIAGAFLLKNKKIMRFNDMTGKRLKDIKLG